MRALELALMTCDASGIVYFVEGTPTELDRHVAMHRLTRLKATQEELRRLRELGAVPTKAQGAEPLYLGVRT